MQVGENIDYNLKGKNFEFIKRISDEEIKNRDSRNNNFRENKINLKEPVKVKQ